MSNDIDTTVCPCCHSLLSFDSAGDLVPVEDNRPGNRGVNGLRVHEAAGNDWKQRRYVESEPKRYVPPSSMVAGIAGKQNQPEVDDCVHVEPDPSILKANQADLKQRQIPTDNNDF